jgi:tRNA uridine 5-carboxymethylaminomethyl modification enzyme
MFTSRAEYRLRLRTDNADQRLTPAGISHGLVGDADGDRFATEMGERSRAGRLLDSLTASPRRLSAAGVDARQDGVVRTAFEWLRFPAVTREAALRIWPEVGSIPADLHASLAVDANYASYLDRQDADVASFQRDEGLVIIAGIDYRNVPGLSHEMAERLGKATPPTLGAASRVPGVTPAALVALLPFTRKAA